MQKTVFEQYEFSRKKLKKKEKLNELPFECDVLGVIRTFIPDLCFESSISDVLKKDKKNGNA